LSCELLLDRYVEGTLNRRQMAEVTAHLQHCRACESLLEELKVVDGLLFTTRVPELPPNFTFAVMADAKTVPIAKAPPSRVLSFLMLYVTAAWAMVVVWMAATGTDPRAVASAFATQAGHVFGATSSVFASGYSVSHSPMLVGLGVTVLALDAAVAGAAVFFFLFVRPRLAAQPARAAREVQ
jgi:anti-sigma factor RsiW